MTQRDLFGPTRKRPRPYQLQRRDACKAAWAAGHRSIASVMPTGSGKTFAGLLNVIDWPGRVLWLAPSRELVFQAANAWRSMSGEAAGIDMGPLESSGERFIAGTVATVHRRIERYAADPFTLIVGDEIHHGMAASWRKIFDAFPDAKILGLTATLERGDKQALDDIIDHVVDPPLQVDWGIDEGWLVPFLAKRARIDNNDLRKIRLKGGDFDPAALAKAVALAHESMIDETLKAFEDPDIGQRQTIFFSPSRDAAHQLAERFRARGRTALPVDGEMPTLERARAFEQFAANEVQFLVNFGVILEGVDVPNVSCVAFGRPTKMRHLVVQMAGRGTRPVDGLLNDLTEATAAERQAAIAASAKPNCLLLDFVWASRHKLVTPVDLMLGGTVPDDVRELALKDLEKKARDPREAIKRGFAKNEEKAAKKAQREAEHRERLRLRMEDYDPMAGTEQGEALHTRSSEDITIGQAKKLRSLGWRDDELAGMTKWQAGAAIGEAERRRAEGLATHRQRMTMLKLGMPAPDLISFGMAVRVMDALKAHGWAAVSRSANVRASVEIDVAQRKPSQLY